MGISLIGISHHNTPLAVRELFAFPAERQQELMKEMIARGIAEECVIISTCNRTEVYIYTACPGGNFTELQDLVLEFAGAQDVENIGDYIRFYNGSKAVRHLFHVAAGLESMVMGEDQILGQVKRAHDQARETGTCGVYLNTLFRYAVTAAKKVKTETDLSRTSVSTATMAIKAAEQGLGTLHGKKVMIIGASGKIGSTVLKNLQCIDGAEVYITSRNMGQAGEDHHHKITYRVMEYEKRYELVNEMDAIISATSSPHYTLTYSKMAEKLVTEKPRVLVDLAVPLTLRQRWRNCRESCVMILMISRSLPGQITKRNSMKLWLQTRFLTKYRWILNAGWYSSWHCRIWLLLRNGWNRKRKKRDLIKPLIRCFTVCGIIPLRQSFTHFLDI